MLLLSHRIGLTHPGGELIIKLLATIQTERMQMVSRREGFDAREARVIDPARKHEMANQIVLPHLHSDERHPHLKGDPRLLRKNLYRTALLDHRRQRVEHVAH